MNVVEPRNAILGMAEGLGWEALRPFVESLRETSFAGDVHLFVAGIDETTSERLRHEGISLHPFRRLRFDRNGRVFHAYDPPLQRFRSSRIARFYPSLIRTVTSLSRDRFTAQARLAAFISMPAIGRYFHYYLFLVASGTRYANVMLTDVRDVFFRR